MGYVESYKAPWEGVSDEKLKSRIALGDRIIRDAGYLAPHLKEQYDDAIAELDRRNFFKQTPAPQKGAPNE